jgi:probable selenium-dependent hydroxylase accessory protein YqeC
MNSMWAALGLCRGACVAFIGAGGKTTSVLALSRWAVTHGLTVVVTTTTKIWPPPRMALLLPVDGVDIVEATRHVLRSSPSVAVGSGLTDRGKVVGSDPGLVCRLVESRVADIVLCEADGAAGRSLKVHGEHEPVVPDCATAVALIGGMDVLDREANPSVIHRFDRYLQLFDAEAHAPLGRGTVADILVRAAGRLDRSVPLVFVLNKADEASTRQAAKRVAAELKDRVANPTIVITSHKQFIEQEAALSTSDGAGRGVHATT